MTKLKMFIILVVFGLTPISSFAAAISFLGVADTSSPTASNKSLGSQTGYGGGVLLGFPMAMRLSLETGALYYSRNWTDSTSASETISSQVLEVPVLLRLHMRLLSLGVGGYYDSNQGSLNETGAVNNSSLGYGAYGINPYDYGLVGDVGLHIPVGRMVFIRVDARYLRGLSNVAANSANTYQNRDLQILAGLTFAFGGFGGHHEEMR